MRIDVIEWGIENDTATTGEVLTMISDFLLGRDWPLLGENDFDMDFYQWLLREQAK